MHNLLPQGLGVNLLCKLRVGAVNGKLLYIWFAINGTLHKLVVNLHRHICSRHLTLGHLGVDKCLCVGMLDAHREHECTTATVLCHLARRIAVALHKRHKTCGCEGGVVDRRTLRTQVGQVMTHSTTTLHQLHLLLVDAKDCSVGVGISIKTYHKAIAQ